MIVPPERASAFQSVGAARPDAICAPFTSVTEPLMREGEVGVALSVLYAPFDEMDLEQSYGAPPQQGYFQDIISELQTVEHHVAGDFGLQLAFQPRRQLRGHQLSPGHGARRASRT